jgi:hypothetical protein
MDIGIRSRLTTGFAVIGAGVNRNTNTMELERRW